MTTTSIEWTDVTWNPVTGCTKVSAGCKNCYAEGVAKRFWAKQCPPVEGRPRSFTDVQCHADRLDAPMRWRKPRRVFVNSMSDLFHERVPDRFIDQVFATMALCPQHTFQVLTKRPERMRRLLSDPGRLSCIAQEAAYLDGDGSMRVSMPLPNVWLGVSVEDDLAADERIPLLFRTPAALRFLSCEPLLGPIGLGYTFAPAYVGVGGSPVVGWVIVGGESGPRARACDVAWIRSIAEQCKAAGVPCFVKQLGSRPLARASDVAGLTMGQLDPTDRGHGDDHVSIRLRSRKGGDPSEWPEDLRVREWPAVATPRAVAAEASR